MKGKDEIAAMLAMMLADNAVRIPWMSAATYAKLDPPYAEGDMERGSAESDQILVGILTKLIEQNNPRILNVVSTVISDLMLLQRNLTSVLVRTDVNHAAAFRYLEMAINATTEGSGLDDNEGEQPSHTNQCQCPICKVVREFAPKEEPQVKTQVPKPSVN